MSDLNKFMESFTIEVFGRSKDECTEKQICVKCGKSAKKFKDELSKKEYTLSTFCQDCQDHFFKKDDNL